MSQDRGQDRGKSPAALDYSGFEALLDGHQAALCAFLRGLVHDPELARDLTQDVFCDAWRATLRGDAPFVTESSDTDRRNWLFHAAYCRAISSRRRGNLLRWESLEAGAAPLRERLEAPWEFEARVFERDEALGALGALASDDAALLLLNILHGFTTVEIAAILQMTPAAAKKRLSRAKMRLRAAYLSRSPEHQEAHP